MRYCSRCLYPENHPFGIVFDDEGVCSGCRVHEEKDALDWSARRRALDVIVDPYRNKSGRNYDCIVPVSGGGDTHFIVDTVKNTLGLRPLLVNFNHEFNTRIGIRNLANLHTVFDCDLVSSTLNPNSLKRIARSTLRKFGSLYWHCLAGALTFPVQAAVKFRIPLIVWGVNPWLDQVGMFSHLDEAEMNKRTRKEHGLMGVDALDLVDPGMGVSRRDVQPFLYPFDEEIERVGVRGIYLGNYFRWDSTIQHERMIEQFGYESAVQARTFNPYEDVHCHHSAGLHDYVKFLKYGYGKATDHAVREIRFGRMTREEGIEQVQRYQDRWPTDLPLFLEWAGVSEADFFGAVDRFRDPRVWERTHGTWRLRDSVVNHRDDPDVERARLPKAGPWRFKITPSREPGVKEGAYILMGRGYIDKYNFGAVEDRPVGTRP